MNIKEYLKNVHGKIKRGYTKEAREMLDSLRISLDGNDRLGGYKPTGLRLERDIDMVDKKEVYVLKLRQGTPEYAVGKKVLDIIPKMYKLLEKKEVKKPEESSLEDRVQANVQNLRDCVSRLKEVRRDLFTQRAYVEEPDQAKGVEDKVREPTPPVTEPEKPRVYIKAPLPEALRSYLLDVYNKIEAGKLKKARKKLGKLGRATIRHHPQTMQLFYRKLVRAENEKREKSSVFWNKCKRAVAYGLVTSMLLFFSGASIKHELEQRAMDDLPEKLEPLPPYYDEEIEKLKKRVEEYQNRPFKMDETGRAYKELTC